MHGRQRQFIGFRKTGGGMKTKTETWVTKTPFSTKFRTRVCEEMKRLESPCGFGVGSGPLSQHDRELLLGTI